MPAPTAKEQGHQLSQRFFLLDERRYADLLKSLREPPRPTAQLRKLLADRSPWEK